MPASCRPSPASTCAAAIAAFIVAVAATAAPAQQAPESPPAAWRVECSGDGKTLDCRAFQQVFHRESRQLLVSAAVRPAADGKSGAMVMTLPLGLNLTEPVSVKVDNGTPERQPIQTCTNVGCFVAMTLTDKLVARDAHRQRAQNHRAGRQQEADRHEPAAARFRHRLRQGQMNA
jgi:invasion protein IalB